MKNHSAAEAAAVKTHAQQLENRHRFEEIHLPQVNGFCFSASQRKAK